MEHLYKSSLVDKSTIYCHHKNPFINKLFDILENNREPEIIAWSAQGTSFVVNDRELFSQRILPSLFSHKNLSSFTRQLNMYDFKRCKAPRGKLSYSHPCFRKGRSDLLRNIKRNRKSEKAIESSQETGLTYEDLLKSNEELKSKQNALEKKLKLSYKLITTLLRNNPNNNNNAVPSFDKTYELAAGTETSIAESENTDVPSQLHFEQHAEYEDFGAIEPSPKKMLFQGYETLTLNKPLSFLRERSPVMDGFQNMSFSNLIEISPFNFNPLSFTKIDSCKQQDPLSWDAVMNNMMFTGSLNQKRGSQSLATLIVC